MTSQEEAERGITIYSACVQFTFDGKNVVINLLDTPGTSIPDRGRAASPRARWRRRGVLRPGRSRGPRAKPVLAAGEQIQGSANRLHQQARPHRRRLLARRGVDQASASARAPCRSRSRSAREDKFQRRESTSIEMKAIYLRRRPPGRCDRRGRGHPRRSSRPRPRSTATAIDRGRRRDGRRPDPQVPRGRGVDGRGDEARASASGTLPDPASSRC